MKKESTEALLCHPLGNSCSKKLFREKGLKLFEFLFHWCIWSWNPFLFIPHNNRSLLNYPMKLHFWVAFTLGNMALCVNTLGFGQRKPGRLPMSETSKGKLVQTQDSQYIHPSNETTSNGSNAKAGTGRLARLQRASLRSSQLKDGLKGMGPRKTV